MFRPIILGVSLAGVVALAAAQATLKNSPAPHPWQFDYYRPRVTAGAQCRYADGSKAVLLRTRDPRKMAFTVTSWPTDEPMVPLEFDRSGEFHHDANGGVTTYNSIRLAVENLLTLPTRPVTGATLDRFMKATDIPACRLKAFYVDLYTEQPLK